jgi:SAM-dependent methyltransferase
MTVNFSSPALSHAHSLQTLDSLYEYDDFMQSVGTLADMGCGPGLDLEWWATRTTRDDSRTPLNISCTGIDQAAEMPLAHRYKNIQYHCQDFEAPIGVHKRKFDVVWCHDAFQYVINPFETLRNWRNVMNDDGMLVIIVPQTTNMEFNVQANDQPDYCYYHWTMVSLIHVLAVSGFDCSAGFFRKDPVDKWLHAAVYKSAHEPADPRKTSWYELAERNLLPESAAASVQRYGYLKQRDLVLPWLDKSLTWFARH